MIPVAIAAAVGFLLAVKGVWIVSEVKFDDDKADEMARGDAEDVKDVVSTAAGVTQSVARISSTAIIGSITFPAIFQISLTFEMPFGYVRANQYLLSSGTAIVTLNLGCLCVYRFPPVLIQFAEWVTAIVSFDVGQIGSPECALPDDPEQTLLVKFLLTVRAKHTLGQPAKCCYPKLRVCGVQ
jgi:hypothetical protein